MEYPSVVGGTFGLEFLDLPEEVLTTTLIHHQHYFPVEAEDGSLKNAFLAVINTEPDNERTIARNAERVVTARLRDARFFWEADRKAPLETRIERLSTLLFHKKLGSYRQKAERIERLAGWIAREAFGASEAVAAHAAKAARLAKADLTTDMVRELTELQGVMGGIYARHEGLPDEVWKAIYFHYLPVGVEADAPPSHAQLGKARVTWAAVSLADKLDTIAGLIFKANEQPTGSRDPYGLRRAAHGVMRILVDLRPLCGVVERPLLRPLFEKACEYLEVQMPSEQAANPFRIFLMERLRHLMQARGLGYEEIQVVTGDVARIEDVNVAGLFDLASEWRRIVGTAVFASAAEAHKRATKILEREWDSVDAWMPRDRQERVLQEPAETALRSALDRVAADIQSALHSGDSRRAIEAMASIQPHIAQFFDAGTRRGSRAEPEDCQALASPRFQERGLTPGRSVGVRTAVRLKPAQHIVRRKCIRNRVHRNERYHHRIHESTNGVIHRWRKNRRRRARQANPESRIPRRPNPESRIRPLDRLGVP